MPTPTLARGLQVSTNERSLTFTGLDPLVSEVFRRETLLYGMVRWHQLAAGESSHDYTIRGGSAGSASRAAPGQYRQGSTTTQAKVNISIDDVEYHQLNLPVEDLDLSMWDQIEPTSRECFRIVKEAQEDRLLRIMALAARTAAVSGVHDGGTVVRRSGSATVATAYAASSTGAGRVEDDAIELMYQMDKAPNYTPKDPRFRKLLILPELEQALMYSSKLIHRDYTTPDVGNWATRYVGQLAGASVFTVPVMPSTNVTTDLSAYNGDFSGGSNTAEKPVMMAIYEDGSGHGVLNGVRNRPPVPRVFFDMDYEVWKVRCSIRAGYGAVETWKAGMVGIHS